jgi:hypothetical protein
MNCVNDFARSRSLDGIAFARARASCDAPEASATGQGTGRETGRAVKACAEMPREGDQSTIDSEYIDELT